MFLGIDIGTSAVKAVLVDGEERICAQASAPLAVSRPRPDWSEQDPADWWRATGDAVRAIGRQAPGTLAAVAGIGLSGQMHGATLLDAADRPLRPAILWNDGRSAAECAAIEAAEPRSRAITGNIAMPGFTAPKLLWVRAHEPEVFARTARVLLPKDYVRLMMTGEAVSDMSDAAGTLWLDVGRRDWSEAMLAATGLGRQHMPALVEGSSVSGALRPAVAAEWGVPAGVPVAGGAGDNAAGAVGVGVTRPGAAFLSIGTSGVIFTPTARFAPNPAQAVHAFCHALPGLWHQMAVLLSAGGSLAWLAALLGRDAATLLAEAEAATATTAEGGLFFLPYLSGERTPHNDPSASGAFVGLRAGTSAAEATVAVLEGVAYAFADGMAALAAAGTRIERLTVIGGGARSTFWGRILAEALDRPLDYPAGADLGPAFGAARLGRLAATGEPAEAVCTPPAIERAIEPDPAAAARHAERLGRFRSLYQSLRAWQHGAGPSA